MELYARLTKDYRTGDWILTCDLCGLKESYYKYWNASDVLVSHREMHEAAGDLRTEGPKSPEAPAG